MGVPLAGLFMFIVGSFLTPPFGNFITNKLGIKIATRWKVLICVICVFIGGAIYSNSDAYKKVLADEAYNKAHPTATSIPTAIPTNKPMVIALTQKAKLNLQTTTKPQPTKQPVQNGLTEESVKAQVIKLEDSSQRVMGKKELSRVEVIDDFRVMEENFKPSYVIVSLFYKPKDIWDEKWLLKVTTSTTAAASELLFANPKVSVVRVTTLVDFTDSYGKPVEQKAVQIEIYKETANKINWKMMKEMTLVDYNKLLNIADDVFIHRAIKSKL